MAAATEGPQLGERRDAAERLRPGNVEVTGLEGFLLMRSTFLRLSVLMVVLSLVIAALVVARAVNALA